MFVNKKLQAIDSKLIMHKEEAPIDYFKVSRNHCTYFIDDVFNLILVTEITKGEVDLFHTYSSNKVNEAQIATIQNISSLDNIGPYYVNNNIRFPLFKADAIFSEAREKLQNLRKIIKWVKLKKTAYIDKYSTQYIQFDNSCKSYNITDLFSLICYNSNDNKTIYTNGQKRLEFKFCPSKVGILDTSKPPLALNNISLFDYVIVDRKQKILYEALKDV